MLREKVIENLKKYEVDMDFWFNCSGHPLCEVSLCNTSACFAGHILFAKNIPLINVSECGVKIINTSMVEDKWISYEVDKFHSNWPGVREYVLIPALARQLWAEEYGDEAAKALPFYEFQYENTYVTSAEIIEYLELEHDKHGRRKVSW